MDTLELQPNVNTGLLIRPPQPNDIIAGDDRSLAAVARLESANWKTFLPMDETQYGLYFDTMACVTFSALNSLETQANWMLANNLIPAAILARINELGYIENGKFNFSDRFTAKMSGTTRQGNYLTSVWDSIRNHGVLPEKDWAYPREQRTPAFDWDDYYKEIPQELKDKALEFRKIFETRYEWVIPGDGANQANFQKWLRISPLQLATAVCSPWNTTEIIKACSLSIAHATMMYSANDAWYDIEDHYKPFQKRLEQGYHIPFALQGVLLLKPTAPITPPTPPMPTPIDPNFGKKQAGKLLLAVEDRGSVWYVTPEGKRVKIGRSPEEVNAFLQAIQTKTVPVLGINNTDLGKIATV